MRISKNAKNLQFQNQNLFFETIFNFWLPSSGLIVGYIMIIFRPVESSYHQVDYCNCEYVHTGMCVIFETKTDSMGCVFQIDSWILGYFEENHEKNSHSNFLSVQVILILIILRFPFLTTVSVWHSFWFRVQQGIDVSTFTFIFYFSKFLFQFELFNIFFSFDFSTFLFQFWLFDISTFVLTFQYFYFSCNFLIVLIQIWLFNISFWVLSFW